MSDIRGCTFYEDNGCIFWRECARAIVVIEKRQNGLISRPDYWRGGNECNSLWRIETIADEREALSEARREHLQDTLP